MGSSQEKYCAEGVLTKSNLYYMRIFVVLSVALFAVVGTAMSSKLHMVADLLIHMGSGPKRIFSYVARRFSFNYLFSWR